MRWLRKFVRRGELDGGRGEGGEDGPERFGGRLGRGGRGTGADGLRAHPSTRWPSGDVVAECEAFLTGTYRQMLVRSGRAVPGWAWINQLAHGTMEDVRTVARFAAGSTRGRGNGPAGGARQRGRDGDEAVGAFVGRLARQVLVKIRQEQAPLGAIQRDLLIPLELALATQTRPVPAAADDLSRAVSQRLVSGLEPIDVGARGAAHDDPPPRRARGQDRTASGSSGTGRSGTGSGGTGSSGTGSSGTGSGGTGSGGTGRSGTGSGGAAT